jgi:hypothetical protein
MQEIRNGLFPGRDIFEADELLPGIVVAVVHVDDFTPGELDLFFGFFNFGVETVFGLFGRRAGPSFFMTASPPISASGSAMRTITAGGTCRLFARFFARFSA